jgi:hypothetical protein
MQTETIADNEIWQSDDPSWNTPSGYADYPNPERCEQELTQSFEEHAEANHEIVVTFFRILESRARRPRDFEFLKNQLREFNESADRMDDGFLATAALSVAPLYEGGKS